MDQDAVWTEDAVPMQCTVPMKYRVRDSRLEPTRRAAREVRLLVVCLLGMRDSDARARLRRSALAATLSSIEAWHSTDPRQVRRFLRSSLRSTREVCSLSRRYASDDRLSGDEAANMLRIGDRAETLLVEALDAD